MDRDLRDADSGGDSPRRLPDCLPRETDALFPGKSADEDASLELTLGPPGEKRGYHGASSPFPSSDRIHPSNSYLQLQSGNKTSAADVESSLRGAERSRGLFVPPPPPARNNASQKRSAPAAVVGWPPIRSFRKSLAGTSSMKQSGPETRNVISADKSIDGENCAGVTPKGSFLKINMDGVPIGRKVDIGSCGSYEKLASTVEELFHDLLAAQTDSSGVELAKPITGLLDGTGEYTLVYEDHEGDRVLVGDVPWKMFVATARRLYALKRSNLPVIDRLPTRPRGA